ncbi:MAG: LssY C-terminal domain-containing protein, partial [Desulfobacteraceae bacterium]
MRKMNRYILLSAVTLCLLLILGCASFQPRPMAEVPFKDRAQTQSEGRVRVTAAVLSAEESKEVFGVDLYKKSIQPIWFEVENREKEPVSFLPGSVDRDYFTPLEVSHLNHFTDAKDLNQEMDRHFYDQSMGYTIGSNKVRSGFVFTHLDEGTKAFNVVVITENHQIRPFTFFIAVPGIKTDHSRVDWDNLYPKDEIVTLDEAGLRKALESLPCCVTSKDGKEYGDPLNLVIIGDLEDVYYAFIRAGWDETETIYRASAIRTGISFVFGGRYRYSPVSPLYVYGRPQDIALQKARETIHERNHLRLYLTP